MYINAKCMCVKWVSSFYLEPQLSVIGISKVISTLCELVGGGVVLRKTTPPRPGFCRVKKILTAVNIYSTSDKIRKIKTKNL